jgi:retron-type reverse transcriptase
MPGELNSSFVLDMQRRLYRWSDEDPNKVFADLFNLVSDRRTLAEAWRRLARNSGSRTPGTDRMTRRSVETRAGGVAKLLDEIGEALSNGSYKPEPVRQRLIPKPGKPGQLRPLGIPTLIDRVVQMALKLILEPIFEADSIRPPTGSEKDAVPTMLWSASRNVFTRRAVDPTSTGTSLRATSRAASPLSNTTS